MLQYHASISPVPRASKEQIEMATDLLKKLRWKGDSVTEIPDPGTIKKICRIAFV